MNRNEVKCRYLTIESHIGSRTTYGIAAVDATLGETAILESYVDVTCDEVQMENFTALCNISATAKDLTCSTFAMPWRTGSLNYNEKSPPAGSKLTGGGDFLLIIRWGLCFRGGGDFRGSKKYGNSK